jgi:hypothetical protein
VVKLKAFDPESAANPFMRLRLHEEGADVYISTCNEHGGVESYIGAFTKDGFLGLFELPSQLRAHLKVDDYGRIMVKRV